MQIRMAKSNLRECFPVTTPVSIGTNIALRITKCEWWVLCVLVVDNYPPLRYPFWSPNRNVSGCQPGVKILGKISYPGGSCT